MSGAQCRILEFDGVMMFEAAMSAFRVLADVGVPTFRTTFAIERPTVVSTRPGRLLRVSVTRAGITCGIVHDADMLIDACARNAVALIPPRIGVLNLADWPMEFGVCIVPGIGMTVVACAI